MSYYFPFGVAEALTVQNIDYATTAITASVPEFSTISVSTASYVQSVEIAPASGLPGISRTSVDCPPNPALELGFKGLQGQQGDKGANRLSCAPGTKECPQLNVSLSLHVNPYRPSGSQFSIVCIETTGYVATTVVCPEYLPTSSLRLLPLTPQ